MENIKNYDMDERIFLKPGDIVQVRHKSIKYRPMMYIVEKITRQFCKSGEEIENAFVGMKCRWFTSDGIMQEAVFSTKDLELCK